MNNELKVRQISLFFIAFLPIGKIITLPSILAGIADENILQITIANLIVDFLTVFVLLKITRQTDKTYCEILEELFSKKGAKIIYMIYIVYFMAKCLIPISENREYIDQTLYITMPSLIYFIPFFLTAFYLSTKKIRTLGRLSDISFLLTLIGITFLFALSIGSVDFGALLPLKIKSAKSFGNGFTSSLLWYGDSVYLAFFLGNFKREKKDAFKILSCYFISGIAVILFMIVFYGIFSSIAFRQRFALTEISKYQIVISNSGRVDYFAIMLILFSNVISMALPIFFASKLLDKVFGFKKHFISPLIVTSIVFIFMNLLNRFNYSLLNFMTNGFWPVFLIMNNILPILFFLIYKVKLKGEINESNAEN